MATASAAILGGSIAHFLGFKTIFVIMFIVALLAVFSSLLLLQRKKIGKIKTNSTKSNKEKSNKITKRTRENKKI